MEHSLRGRLFQLSGDLYYVNSSSRYKPTPLVSSIVEGFDHHTQWHERGSPLGGARGPPKALLFGVASRQRPGLLLKHQEDRVKQQESVFSTIWERGSGVRAFLRREELCAAGIRESTKPFFRFYCCHKTTAISGYLWVGRNYGPFLVMTRGKEDRS